MYSSYLFKDLAITLKFFFRTSEILCFFKNSSNKSLKAAVETGDLFNGAFMAGSASAYLEKIEPVETIIQRIMKK